MNKHGSKHITAPERDVILDMLKRDCKLKDIALAIAKIHARSVAKLEIDA